MASALKRLGERVGISTREDDDQDIAGIDEEDESDDDSEESGDSGKDGNLNRDQGLTPDRDLFTDSKTFCSVVAFLVLMQIICSGIQADLKCRGADCDNAGIVGHMSEAIDQVFTLVFVLETAFRLVDAKPRRYFLGERTRAKCNINAINCIDFAIVSIRVLDVWILSLAGMTSHLRLFSWMRLIRFVPFVKTMQLNKAFRELWLVLSAVGETLKTLFWVGVMTLGVVWVCGILVAMTTIDYTAKDFDFSRSGWGFDNYWGRVMTSSMSLFQFATRDKWADSLVWPLVERHHGLMVLFLLFFIVAGMALMNAIVGVVVECTLTASKANDELSKKDREKVDNLVMESLRQIFKEADTDGSGELDKPELHAALCTHRVRDRLKFLSIPFKDLMMLFELLDESGSGQINTDMFFRGVSRLRGQAAASDLHQMSVDLRKHLYWCDDHLGQVDAVNDCLGSLVDMIDDFDSSIVRGESDVKDPVLMQRRTRPKASKGEALRGRASYFQLSSSAPKGSKNVWLEFDETQIRDDRSGGNLSKTSMSQKGSKGRQGSKATDGSQESQPKKKVVVKASRKNQKALANPNQPAPPPLPLHLQRLKDQRETKGPKRGRGKKDDTPAKGRNQFEF